MELLVRTIIEKAQEEGEGSQTHMGILCKPQGVKRCSTGTGSVYDHLSFQVNQDKLRRLRFAVRKVLCLDQKEGDETIWLWVPLEGAKRNSPLDRTPVFLSSKKGKNEKGEKRERLFMGWVQKNKGRRGLREDHQKNQGLVLGERKKGEGLGCTIGEKRRARTSTKEERSIIQGREMEAVDGKEGLNYDRGTVSPSFYGCKRERRKKPRGKTLIRGEW